MNKTQLIDALAARLGDRRTATTAVDGLIETIVDAVRVGEAVSLTGFGVFEARARAPRVGRNLRTGEVVDVPAATVPTFRPGARFRTAVGGGGGPAPRGTPARRDVTASGSASSGSASSGSANEAAPSGSANGAAPSKKAAGAATAAGSAKGADSAKAAKAEKAEKAEKASPTSSAEEVVKAAPGARSSKGVKSGNNPKAAESGEGSADSRKKPKTKAKK